MTGNIRASKNRTVRLASAQEWVTRPLTDAGSPGTPHRPIPSLFFERHPAPANTHLSPEDTTRGIDKEK